MTYKVYIKQDYKAKIVGGRSLTRGVAFLALAGLVTGLVLMLPSRAPDHPHPESKSIPKNHDPAYAAVPDSVINGNPASFPASYTDAANPNMEPEGIQPVAYHPDPVMDAPDYDTFIEENIIPEPETPAGPDWQEVTVKKGDSMARIFKRLDLSPALLHRIMNANEHSKALKKILPGQILRFDIEDGQLKTMEYDIDFDRKLVVENQADQISVDYETIDLEKRVRHASATITNSLYLAGQSADLTDNIIMQLVTIYGWDIDFALNIRKGDHFSVIFEEYYRDGEKVQDGPILAAEFTNRGKSYRAVRFTHENGDSQYYSETGHSMRKAFLRTPVKFSRISSRFNLQRKHPILNRIRAHKGVDYAAPTGTPVKATGDGVITYKGRKGGYGRTIAIKHGSIYSTLYAHLSRYGKNLRHGTRVKQGQIIGYVGSSGLATGPHLHYEFRVHGVHRNPLTVKLPKAMRIPDDLMDDFIAQTTPLLAQLDDLNRKTKLADTEPAGASTLIAMNEETDPRTAAP